MFNSETNRLATQFARQDMFEHLARCESCQNVYVSMDGTFWSHYPHSGMCDDGLHILKRYVDAVKDRKHHESKIPA